MVEMTPELREQLNEQKKQCIFCRITSGEIPSEIVLKDEGIVSVMDINPCSKAHVLMYPEEHYPIMPYIPSGEFFNLFGALPQMTRNIKKASLSDSITVFIANGAVAGQQSPHFLYHVIGRDARDRVGKFSIDKKADVDPKVLTQLREILLNNIPIMLQNHARRNPQYVPKVRVAKEGMIYNDEWVSVIMPEDGSVLGHIIITPNNHDAIDDMPVEEAAHLFFVSSFVATALFESLGAHGTNIILHSGIHPDNDDGKCKVHVIARFQDDGLEIIPQPLESKPDIKTMADKIKSDRIFIPYQLKEARRRISQAAVKPKDIDAGSEELKQIEDAISRLRKHH
jgi:histidine triad (HIT) family protein